MNELVILLIAAGCAAAMAMLVRSGVEANLRSAVRTTLILGVAWGFAWASRHADTATTFSLRTWILLALSGIAVVLSWMLYLWFGRKQRHTAGPAPMDRINVVLAAAFAVALFYGRAHAASWLYGLLILAGALILARKPI
ncbi:MAG: hypothetical protein ABS95_00365 [Verrucomicrobia bacterium SCN 57-15]|nr:MAG: hypothetical protein ABS95_00365 [Verrucomicrobia bacterium SCN 57-15]